ncbi:hypothetical protein ACHHYP_04394 [Achlya hypogyna]|uniref:M96 mating-specific protein family n=1 Tax=Achlya hypogyna TaxID=1202772 RepID=A0A1V9Z1Q4_ACHHY|nr:hypothetical protein ACHHYP_04394 [Achlya hypogyna]
MAGSALHDLEFLIATDAELDTELSAMCDILSTFNGDAATSSTSSSVSSPILDRVLEDFSHPPAKRKAPSPEPVQAKNKFQFRQRQEILKLRADVAALQVRLNELKAKEPTTPAAEPATAWAAIAKQELLTKTEALQENAHLRSEVDRQATFVETMVALFRKRPLLQDTTNGHMADWKQYKLAAALHLRTAAIHAIADREYSRQQTAFLNAGLYPASPCPDFRTEAEPQPNGTCMAKFIGRESYAAPIDVVAAAFWDAVHGGQAPEVPAGASLTEERVDADTLYLKYHTHADETPIFLNMIFKKYREATRRVVIWRSVVEDALLPHMSVGVRGVQWGWATMEAMPDGQTLFTFLCHVNNGLLKDALVILTKMNEFGFCKQVLGAPLNWDEMRRNPMEVFMERGRRWEIAFRVAIANAVKKYNSKDT